jgi:hypothetical protein
LQHPCKGKIMSDSVSNSDEGVWGFRARKEGGRPIPSQLGLGLVITGRRNVQTGFRTCRSISRGRTINRGESVKTKSGVASSTPRTPPEDRGGDGGSNQSPCRRRRSPSPPQQGTISLPLPPLDLISLPPVPHTGARDRAHI